MNYLLTLLLTALCIVALIKSKKITTPAILLIATTFYGIFVFPHINGIMEAVRWRTSNTDGTVTYQFTTRAIEKDWTNPKYWDYLLNQIHQDYWWATWPAYFGIMYIFARLLRSIKSP